MKTLYYFILLQICISSVTCQTDSNNYIKYTPEFKFKDGLFFNFNQVRNNIPIVKSRIVTTLDYDDPYFFERLLEKNKISYFNEIGSKKEIPVKSIWGYSKNGNLYIGINSGFYRITLIGKICHFIANYTTYSTYYPSTGYYSNSYMQPPVNQTNTELRQYLLDFENGNILNYTVESMEVLLMKDPELHDEYMSLSRRKKKQQKFLYIRKFNIKNPLYIPNNKFL